MSTEKLTPKKVVIETTFSYDDFVKALDYALNLYTYDSSKWFITQNALNLSIAGILRNSFMDRCSEFRSYFNSISEKSKDIFNMDTWSDEYNDDSGEKTNYISPDQISSIVSAFWERKSELYDFLANADENNVYVSHYETFVDYFCIREAMGYSDNSAVRNSLIRNVFIAIHEDLLRKCFGDSWIDTLKEEE